MWSAHIRNLFPDQRACECEDLWFWLSVHTAFFSIGHTRLARTPKAENSDTGSNLIGHSGMQSLLINFSIWRQYIHHSGLHSSHLLSSQFLSYRYSFIAFSDTLLPLSSISWFSFIKSLKRTLSLDLLHH